MQRVGGTSPLTMRSARPSTSAVLPTPGSPTMIGLFFRRRARMSMICRISRSRPKMGSIFPSRAFAVNEVVKRDSASSPRAAGAPPAGAAAAARRGHLGRLLGGAHHLLEGLLEPLAWRWHPAPGRAPRRTWRSRGSTERSARPSAGAGPRAPARPAATRPRTTGRGPRRTSACSALPVRSPRSGSSTRPSTLARSTWKWRRMQRGLAVLVLQQCPEHVLGDDLVAAGGVGPGDGSLQHARGSGGQAPDEGFRFYAHQVAPLRVRERSCETLGARRGRARRGCWQRNDPAPQARLAPWRPPR